VVEPPDRIELTMDQHLTFTKNLKESVFGTKLNQLTETASKVYGLPSNASLSGADLKYTTALLVQLISCL
jgi:hypothetical protein